MRQVIVRVVGACVASVVFVVLVVWYASVHRHVPEGWPRVYLASGCPASEFAMEVAEGASESVSLVTIPLDDGGLSTRACRHTVGLLARESFVWYPVTLLPDSLVCSRLIMDGAVWMARNRYHEWPVFVGGNGAVHLGADVEGLRTVGLDASDEEYGRMVERFAAGGDTRPTEHE
jgi:hypothetical protein